MRLFADRVSANKKVFADTISANKKLFADSDVPIEKKQFRENVYYKVVCCRYLQIPFFCRYGICK